MPVLFKTVSAMEKCFTDSAFADIAEKKHGSALLGEEYAFELVLTSDDESSLPVIGAKLSVSSPLAEFVSVCEIASVPVRFAAYPWSDDDFLRKAPGLYPDLLIPLDSYSTLFIRPGELHSYYVKIKLPETLPENVSAGDNTISFAVIQGGATLAEADFTLRIIDKALPPQTLLFTQWFHADCIADYYSTGTFTEKHWEYIANFMKTAAENGINTILTPMFTPPLDTAVGLERPTTQLADVYFEDGAWRFGFERLERWIKTAEACGITHFEISHLYTQWGAAHAPKVMGWRDGRYSRLFGWDTDASSEEYRTFLREFIKALILKLDSLGVTENTLWHISDEPNRDQLESYMKAKNQISDILEARGLTTMDALSDFDFYKTGAVTHPIPASNHIAPFIEAGVENLWTYYCCGQTVNVSNRMIAMSMDRGRIIGLQMWKYKITGFLQWGYNFYNSQGSVHRVNPFLVTDGDFFTPAGDCYSVYPGENGVPLESLHLKCFTMALTDMRALALAEKLTSREKVLEVIDPENSLTFSNKPVKPSEELREKINELIEQAE